MAQLTIEVPDFFSAIPQPKQTLLIRSALHQATQGLIEWLKKEVAEADQQIKRFETHYGVTFTRFETELLPTLDSFEAHNDYNDWFFLQSVLNERQQLLTQLQRFDLN